jgi:integrase
MTLVMGLRAGEVVSRVVRDLDDGGQLFWIPDSKTEAGKRTLQVPEVLRPYLLALAEGKKSDELLFGYHDRNWPRKWVARICKAAGVPRVTAHGMRGLHGTLAVETGRSAHAVAAALGH